MRSLAFLAYLPWLAQATHAVMASSPGSGADCDNTSVSYPVGVSELTFDTDSVINHYATNATKPPAAKHCTFDALCGTSERFLDDSFQAGRHAFTGGVEPTTPAAPPRPSARARTVVTNQDAIDAAKTAQKDWDERNMKLYGLSIQAMPAWLRADSS